MRILFYCALPVVVLIGYTSAAETRTLEFDPALVRYEIGTTEIAYSDCQSLVVLQGLCLPTEVYYICLRPGEQISSLSWSVVRSAPLTEVKLQSPRPDVPTALDGATVPTVTYPDSAPKLGHSVIYVDREIRCSERRLARIVVFPVTVDSSGSFLLNELVTIRVADRVVSADELIDQAETCLQEDATRSGTLAPSQADADYVIITSAELSESLLPLDRYKTSTGYAADVVAIEDIVAAHSGRDDAEKLREYLKQFHSRGGRYVLLAGDETVLPTRYAFHATAAEKPELSNLQIADLYFADLTGEWDADDDGVWGEYLDDLADFTPELLVGRLPFNRPDQFAAYTDKLIAYETAPGNNNADYLNRVFFFSSDQMRDYGLEGQHALLAQGYPGHCVIDTTNGLESPSGGAPIPDNQTAPELIEKLSQGYGFVNILAHGRSDAFAVRTSKYNDWPKSYFITDEPTGDHGTFAALEPNNRTAFYYSVSCNCTGFDQDNPPFCYTNPLIAEQLLSLPEAGAVGFIGYSRWGWVSKSHLLQRAFIDLLFAHPDCAAIEAMYAAQAEYYYYRDLVLGQNFHGDPTLRVYSDVPSMLDMTVEYNSSFTFLFVTDEEEVVADCSIILSRESDLVERTATDAAGQATLLTELELGAEYTIAAVKEGYVINRISFTPSITTDIITDETVLPFTYSLGQNYPNPFNPQTVIEFELPARAEASLTVYNVLGQPVRVLVRGRLPAGRYTVYWDGTNGQGSTAPSGVYFYRLETAEFSEVKKMVLVR